jgi:hypothetical protein
MDCPKDRRDSRDELRRHRANPVVDGSRLRSLVNGKNYSIATCSLLLIWLRLFQPQGGEDGAGQKL